MISKLIDPARPSRPVDTMHEKLALSTGNGGCKRRTQSP